MTDAELLANLKAREELEARGFTRKMCENCRGAGLCSWEVAMARREMGRSSIDCPACSGKGYLWIGPETKEHKAQPPLNTLKDAEKFLDEMAP